MQTWNDIYGRTFEAEVVSKNPALVRLRNSEGKEIDFQIMQLSPESQNQVRNWVDKDKKGAEPTEFVKGFKDDLVILDGKSLTQSKDPNIGDVKYFAFYRSASWCGPCRNFTPDLVKFYNRTKKKHPEFELIFMSSDRSEKAMEDYMKDDNMKWPAFKFGEHKSVVRSYGNGIPCLIVTDASGNKLFDSYTKDGKYIGPKAVIREIENLLE